MMQEHAALLARTCRSWIGGKEWSQCDAEITHLNPANGQSLGASQCLGAEGVDAAVSSARRAFQGDWGRQTTGWRTARLLAFADLIARNVDDLALLESLEVGRPLADARALVAQAPEFIRRYARMAEVCQGDLTAAQARLLTFSWRRPRGVVAAIVPWNFPVMAAIVRIAPALAAGNTVVLKPSENAPRAPRLLASLATEAGLPDGVFNVTLGDGATTGRLLAEHHDVDLVSFTGSTASGLAVSRSAVTVRAKPVILECGGKSPQIMLDDAFDDPAVWQGVFFSAFWNTGQWCAARTRLLVPRSRLAEAIEGLEKVAATWPLGDPLAPTTRLGPLVNAAQRERVLEYFEVARGEGRLQDLGCPSDSLDPAGQFVRPAVVIEPSRGGRITREEVFGPLLTVETFNSVDDALAQANASDYGLMASVWTSRSADAYRFARELEVGCVAVYSSAEAAFSSMQDFVNSYLEPQKRSGHGVDGGLPGLLAYTTAQSVSLFN
jgi:gamma-glutamyl-gamma-aminobutyraldehyde dehydrogenase